jgi:hypothetical protein
VVRAPDTAAELMQLREAEAVRAVDHDRVRGWHVDARLDDGGAQQDVETPMVEVDHERFEIALAHLPVTDPDAGLRQQLAEFLAELVDRLHLVVHEVDLATATQLAQAGLADGGGIPVRDEGLDRDARRWGRRDQRQLAQSAERHVQGPRDRRRREREHVDLRAQRLQALLVAHAEAMLLVDDQQAEVAELRIRMQQPMRRDDDVDLAGLEPLEDRLRLLPRAEARQRFDAHRMIGEAVAEVRGVLLGEQRRRHEHRHLLARLHGHERRAHRDFRLAEADVAADDAIHRPLAREILQHLRDRVGLIGRLLEREAFGERSVFLLVDLERKAGARLALSVEVEQLGRDVAHLLGGLATRLRPLVGAELVERG